MMSFSVLLKWLLMSIFFTYVSAVTWKITTYTGTVTDALSDANAYVELRGENAISKNITLDSPGDDFKYGAIDIFPATTPDLGLLQSVKLIYEKIPDRWFMEKMTVENVDVIDEIFTFEFHDWVPHITIFNVTRIPSSSLPSSAYVINETTELVHPSQTVSTYIQKVSRSQNLVELSEVEQKTSKLHLSQASTPLFSTAGYQISEDLKISLTKAAIRSIESSQVVQTSELDLTLISTYAKAAIISIESSQVVQTSELDLTQISTNIFLPNSILDSFRYSSVSSTQYFVKASEICPKRYSVLNNTCICYQLNITSISRDEQIKSLLKELSVDPKSLSNYKRKKISVPDNRVSAKAIGYIGVVTLILPFALIVIIDLMSFVKYYLEK